MKEKLQNYDRLALGVIIGAILPVLGFLLSYPILTRGIPNMTFDRYMQYAVYGIDRQQILIFCMLPNMFMFYLTNFRWRMNNFTKGLVAITLLLGVMLIIMTFNT